MSDYFALWVMQEIMQHHIFLRLPMERLAQLQLVSRRWRDMILDPGFARLRYQTEVAARRSLEVPQSLLVVPNVGGSLDHIEVSRLVSENHGGFRPAYFPISCDGIGFPVDSLVGSCEGLVCLSDGRQEIFVINPLLGRSRRVMQTGLPHVAIGFGAVVLRDVRSFVVLQALDTNLERFVFFNLTTNQWRIIEHHYGQGDWHYDIQQGETVAFAHENFIFQGRIIRGNNVQQALIFYNLCENSFQHIELDREISSHRLQLGVIGPNIAALWGLDDDISRRLRCFWRIDITRLRRYEFNPIAPNPLLQNFEPRHPMSFAGPNQVLMLCRDEWLELCKDGALQRGELHLVHPVLPGWRVGRLQAIAFTRTFVLPGVNANDDNVQTDQQHLPSLRTLDGVPTLGKPFEPLDDANFLRTQLDQQKGVDNLVSNTNLLESEIREARSKKDTFKAHSQSARSATKVSEMVGNVDTSSALSAFDKMEEKVLAMESQAEALGQLNTDTDDLEGKVESSSVGDANLKKELSGSSKNGA